MNCNFKLRCVIIAVLTAIGITANAQYYGFGNQLRDMISPALSGSFNYKGYVDASYLRGLGDDRFDIASVTTTQGFKYSSWFFMGAGAGVDLIIPSLDYDYDQNPIVMVPLFADFRFMIGRSDRVSVNIDLRLGAAFNFAETFPTNNGFIYEDECLYFRPSLSLRIPVNKGNSKQAINIGVTYQLIMTEYSGNRGWDDDKCFNNVGAIIGFEW